MLHFKENQSTTLSNLSFFLIPKKANKIKPVPMENQPGANAI